MPEGKETCTIMFLIGGSKTTVLGLKDMAYV